MPDICNVRKTIECVRKCQNVLENFRICQNVSENVSMCQKLSECVIICQNVSKNVCQKNVRIYQKMSDRGNFAGMVPAFLSNIPFGILSLESPSLTSPSLTSPFVDRNHAGHLTCPKKDRMCHKMSECFRKFQNVSENIKMFPKMSVRRCQNVSEKCQNISENVRSWEFWPAWFLPFCLTSRMKSPAWYPLV